MIPLMYLFNDELNEFSYRMLLTLMDALKDLGVFAFGAIMDLIILILNGMGHLFESINVTRYLGGLPPELLYFANLCSIGECMGMIITAITIRILLQLIPFTRLGS